MIASLVLASILLVLVGFYGLVRLQMAACEAGPAPEGYGMTSAEEWAASIDVALELAWFQTPSAPTAVIGRKPIIDTSNDLYCAAIIQGYYQIMSNAVTAQQSFARYVVNQSKSASHVSLSVKVEGNKIVKRTYSNGSLVCVSRFAATVQNLRTMGLA